MTRKLLSSAFLVALLSLSTTPTAVARQTDGSLFLEPITEVNRRGW